MAKYFKLQQTNGNSTTVVIVVDPVIENGSIRATKVGELDEISNSGKLIYRYCEPAEIIVIGNSICTEIKSIISQLKGNDKLYILGDVIDRGPDGIKILQDIIQRKEKGQVEFLIGNHELMMIQTLFLGDKKQEENWTSKINQGRVTKDAFEKLSANEQNKIKEFLFNSYVYKNINVNSNQVHLVHAKSIQDKNDSTDKTVKEMIDDNSLEKIIEATWDRDKDGESPHKNSAKAGIFTIIGHSPTKNNMIQYKNGYLDIDCGSSRGEIASLVNLTSGRTKYFSVRHEREKESNKQHEK